MKARLKTRIVLVFQSFWFFYFDGFGSGSRIHFLTEAGPNLRVLLSALRPPSPVPLQSAVWIPNSELCKLPRSLCKTSMHQCSL